MKIKYRIEPFGKLRIGTITITKETEKSFWFYEGYNKDYIQLNRKNKNWGEDEYTFPKNWFDTELECWKYFKSIRQLHLDSCINSVNKYQKELMTAEKMIKELEKNEK